MADVVDVSFRVRLHEVEMENYGLINGSMGEMGDGACLYLFCVSLRFF